MATSSWAIVTLGILVVAAGLAYVVTGIAERKPPRSTSASQANIAPQTGGTPSAGDLEQRPLDEPLASVQAAWARRQQESERLRFRVETETFWSTRVWGTQEDGRPIELPETTTVETAELTLISDSFRYLYNAPSPQWITEVGRLVRRDHLTLCTPDVNLTFFGGNLAPSRRFFPMAFYEPARRCQLRAYPQIAPLYMIYRPLDPRYSDALDLAKFRERDAGQDDDQDSILLIERPATGSHSLQSGYRLWLDMEHRYRPARFELRNERGQLFQETFLEYEQVDDGRWAPSGWTTTRYSRMADPQAEPVVEMSIKARVTRAEINGEIPENEFAFALPPDTIVTDYRTNEYYVVREDGSKRPITEKERAADVTQADLVATESGQAVSPE